MIKLRDVSFESLLFEEKLAALSEFSQARVPAPLNFGLPVLQILV
jgi:hypothetical protein